MCLAVPLEIIEINGSDALVQRDGIRRNVRIDFIKNPRPGDWVLVHAGFAIEKVDHQTAMENTEAAKELEAEIRKIAARISEGDKSEG